MIAVSADPCFIAAEFLPGMRLPGPQAESIVGQYDREHRFVIIDPVVVDFISRGGGNMVPMANHT